jgi:hypothetical protein
MKPFLNLRWSLLFLLVPSLYCPAQTTSESYFDSTWTTYFRRNSGGWTAGDATISVPLPDGRVIWLFGDSYTVPVNMTNNTLPCLFQVRNCFMVQDSVDKSHFKTILDTTMTGVNMTTFKLRPNDTSIFWPGHGYVYHDTVYIFQERYKSTTLAYEGCYVAKLTYPDLHQVAMLPVTAAGTSHISGRAVVTDTIENRIYIYSNRVNWIIWEPVVARCTIGNPLAPWEYYTGTGWSTEPGEALKICNDPVSPGFSVFREDGKYHLITQENGYLECGLGREIWSYSSPYPWGPFTGKTLLYTEESKFNGAYLLTYNAQAHPWNIENNELLICYNVNDRVDTLAPYICPSQCHDIWSDRLDADTYRPKFVRVPMELITSLRQPEEQEQGGCLQVNILGNPVERDQSFSVDIHASNPWIGKISLTDLTGRVLWSKSLRIEPAQKTLTFAAPSAGGVYFLELTGLPSCRETMRLLVK